MMKKVLSIVLYIFCVAMYAQTVGSRGSSATTGDTALDASMSVINVAANEDMNAFTTGVAADYGVKPAEVTGVMNRGLKPAEAYMAFETASITGKPVNEVVDVYEQHRDKGWGVVAMEMGIKPGSPEFHKLKKSIKTKGDKMKGKGEHDKDGDKDQDDDHNKGDKNEHESGEDHHGSDGKEHSGKEKGHSKGKSGNKKK